MSVNVDALLTPEPHYIPGYTGHCPQYIFRSGDTYGSVTHKILLDPLTHKSGKLVLSDRSLTDYQVIRPNNGEYQARNYYANSVYKQPMVPGYAGSIPGTGQLGKRFAIDAYEGLLEFEREAIRRKNAQNNLIREIEADNGTAIPTLEERQKAPKQYSLPLLEVRREYSNILRTIAIPEPTPGPDEFVSPYFKQVDDKEKKFKTGYSGHIPFGQSKYGEGYGPSTNSALCDFTNNYRMRQSTEWAPVNVVKAEPPLIISSAEIYHKHLGMVPNYTGHIPGMMFRSGKSYGTDTRDAKRWLRGDRTE